MICHCGCGQYSIDGKYYISGHINKFVKNSKGKTYEEIYGNEKANNIRNKKKVQKGHIAWNKGLTKETDKRILLASKKMSIKRGYRILREVRFCKCGCMFQKEVKVNSNWQYKSGHNPSGMLGKKLSLESCEKMRLAKHKNPTRYWLGKLRLDMQGNKHPNWNQNKTHYGKEFTKKLKNFILYRDKYICQLCSNYYERLRVHHIDYKKYNNTQENLITLCNSCHSKTNFNRTFFINMFRIKTLERQQSPIINKEIELVYIK